MVAFGGIIDDAIVEVEDVGWSVELEAVGVDQAELELLEGFSKATELPRMNQITFLLRRVVKLEILTTWNVFKIS